MTAPKRRVLLVNSSLRAFTEIAGKAASLVLFAVIARRLGEVALGEYVSALALVQILWTVGDFGTNRFLVQEVARDNSAAQRLVVDSMALKAVVTTTLVAIATLLSLVLGVSTTATLLILLLGLSLVLDLTTSVPISVFIAHEQMRYYTYTLVPVKYLQAGLGVVVILLGGGIVDVGLCAVATSAVALVVASWLLLRNYPRPELRVIPGRWPGLFRASGLFGVQEALAQVVMRIDMVLLSLLVAGTAVGWYGAGYRLIDATLFIPWSIGTSALPMYSYLTHDSTPSLRDIYADSMRLVLLIIVPVSVGLALCARQIVSLAYGLEQFGPAVAILQILAFAPVFYAVSNQASTLVLARRRTLSMVKAFGAAAVINIVLNVIFVSLTDYRAAAWITLVTEAFLAFWCLRAANVEVRGVRWSHLLASPLAGGLMMALVLVVAGRSLYLAVPLAGLAYLGVVALVEVRVLGNSLRALRPVAAPVATSSG
jgi:O-antigen/teichoic acid export membrane protein